MKSLLLMVASALCFSSTVVRAENNPPTVAGPGLINAEKNLPRTLGHAELLQLSGAEDAEGDDLKLFITVVISGKMTKNGTPIIPGDTSVAKGESVVWTPPQDEYNTTVGAFKVRAFDGLSHSLSAATFNARITGNSAPTFTTIDPFTNREFRNAWMNTPFKIQFSELFDRSDIVDYDDDPLSFIVGSVPSGSLTVNGSSIIPGQTVVGPGAVLEWTPAASQKGAAITAFTLHGFDGKDKTAHTVPVKIDVLDATPTFKKGADVIVKRDQLDTVILGWATAIGPVDAALQFEVTTDNPKLFSYAPEISADGALTFATDGIQYGVANAKVVLVDDAGRRSAAQAFKIVVNFVNYPPSFELSRDVVEPDFLAGINTVPSFVQSIDPGAPNESDVVKFEVLADNPALFTTKPAINTAGTLTYRLATTANEPARVRVIANDGKARSDAQWFVINVPASPFAAKKGNYTGLFHEVDQVTHDRAGLFNLTLSDRGACSGKLFLGGETISFSGAARNDGDIQLKAKRKDGTPLSLNLELNDAGIIGDILSPSWVAVVHSEKAEAATPGNFTFVVNSSPNAPAGSGAFSYKLSSTGQVTCTGTLPDGSKVTQSTQLSGSKQWPFFRSLYGGAGSIIGWISTDAQTGGGNIVWTKLGTDASQTFVAETTAEGSPFVPNVAPLLLAGHRVVEVSGAGLPVETALPATIAGGSITGSGLKVAVNTKTGLATGTFIHPTTKISTKVYGAALQNRKELRGFFLGNPGSGELSLGQ